MAFMALLDEMYHTKRVRAEHERQKRDQDPSIPEGDTSSQAPSSPSYNLVMTLEHMFLFPRSAEKFTEDDDKRGGLHLELSVNSLGFAGMLLVKGEEELEKVKSIGVGRILGKVGMEPLKEEDDKGCDDVFADLA